MSSLAILRQQQTPWARRVLGMFVVVWLNLALQPCAMAMGGDDDHDCPHCPPAHTQQHDGHEMSPDAMTDHDMPCASGVADCTATVAINVDGRTGHLKLKDVPTDQPDAIVPFAAPIADAAPNLIGFFDPPEAHPPDSSPSLNVLYCVYLI